MVKFRIMYTKNGKPSYLKGASGRVRTFKTKRAAQKIVSIYDYKKKIRVVKL